MTEPFTILITDIPDSGLEVSISIPSEMMNVADLDVSPTGDITFAGMIRRIRDGVLIAGEFSGNWIIACARCLNPFEHPVADRFIAYLSPNMEDPSLSSFDIETDDLDVSELIGNKIHLVDILREQMILQIPIKPICSDSCRGLCPRCGQNLNEVECQCDRVQTDGRLLKLKKFFEK